MFHEDSRPRAGSAQLYLNAMIIKVCGMREADNIRATEQLGVDWLGFIFWPNSSRYVATLPAYLPSAAKRVGVFVDASIEDVTIKASDYQLDIIQLHGHESREYVSEIRNRGLAVMKAISISNRDDIATSMVYEGIANYFLFDTKCKTVGGSGEHFDWSVLNAYDGSTPFLLSGGIGSDDVERVRNFCHPECIGIDLNSRFEISPALKDINKLKQFIQQL
jgi:phosphoribosylanthranilate isomerase